MNLIFRKCAIHIGVETGLSHMDFNFFLISKVTRICEKHVMRNPQLAILKLFFTVKFIDNEPKSKMINSYHTQYYVEVNYI